MEDRTFRFAESVSAFVDCVPKSLQNVEYCRQVIRSFGSVGANYIEANEAVSRKDFVLRIKVCRKEAKESRFWLRLIRCSAESDAHRLELIQEANELTKIFGAIIEKSA